MAKISCIYTITNKVNGKLYVGRTNNYFHRVMCHQGRFQKGKHENIHLQYAYNKYGSENLEIEILEECPIEYLFSQEHYWANLLQSHKYGYNINPTHPYLASVVMPKAVKIAAEKRRGEKLSEESIKKRTETTKKRAEERGYWQTPEQIEKRAQKARGRKFSEEAKRNMSKPKNLSADQLKALSDRKIKEGAERREKIIDEIVCIYKNGSVTTFQNIPIAAHHFSINRSKVDRDLTYKWRYTDSDYLFVRLKDYDNTKDYSSKFINLQKKAVLQYDKEGNFVREYSSGKEASDATNITTTDVTRSCKYHIGKGKYGRVCKGYSFKYKQHYGENILSGEKQELIQTD